jgi:hypothetical protein
MARISKVLAVRITGHGRALGLDPGSLDPMEKSFMEATQQDETKFDPISPSAATIPMLSPVQSSRHMAGSIDVKSWFRRSYRRK